MPDRRRTEELVHAIAHYELAEALTFDELIDAVAARRPHGIKIRSLPGITGEDNFTGWWQSPNGVDTIMHIETDSELYRQQIILHEMAHMMLGHELTESLAATMFPDIDPALVGRLLARSHVRGPEELDAELLADHLAAIVRRARQRQSPFMEVFG